MLGAVSFDRSGGHAWHSKKDARPEWVQGNEIILPRASMARAVVLGEAGSGKTVFLNNCAREAHSRGWRVVVLDAKGDIEDARTLAPLIQGKIAHEFNALSTANSADEAVEALMTVWPQVQGGAEFYRGEFASWLGALMKWGPVQDFDDLSERFSRPARFMDAQDFERLVDSDSEKRVPMTWHRRFMPLARLLSSGWSWADENNVVVPIDPSSESKRHAGRVMLAGLFQQLRRRKERGDERPWLVIIDEFAQLSDGEEDASETASRLFELARSAGVGLLVAGQSVHTLGADERAQKRLLTAGGAIVAGRQSDPGVVAELAGTDPRLEATADAELGGAVSGRAQDAFRVPPQRIRQLPTGGFYLVGNGTATRFMGAMP